MSFNIKVFGINDFKEILEMLVWIFGMKFVECTSALHQSDHVGSQGRHIGSLGELNGVSIALMGWFGVLTKSTCTRLFGWVLVVWWVLVILLWLDDGIEDAVIHHDGE